MIYIVGDTHADIDYNKLGNGFIKDQLLPKPTKNDTIIQVGDLGFVLDLPDNISPTEIYLKEWISAKPWKLITAGGNHENWDRVLKLPVSTVPWPEGNDAYQYTDNVFFARRGRIYEIENKTFFFMGGATSTDKDSRVPFVSWWPEEIPTQDEFAAGLAELEKVNMEVDYVITHTFPRTIVNLLGFTNATCPVSNYLEYLLNCGLKFKKWYGGHFHVDVKIPYKHDSEIICLMDKIEVLNEE